MVGVSAVLWRIDYPCCESLQRRRSPWLSRTPLIAGKYAVALLYRIILSVVGCVLCVIGMASSALFGQNGVGSLMALAMAAKKFDKLMGCRNSRIRHVSQVSSQRVDTQPHTCSCVHFLLWLPSKSRVHRKPQNTHIHIESPVFTKTLPVSHLRECVCQQSNRVRWSTVLGANC